MKERKIVMTSDGSHTIFVPELGEHYHSSYGAIQESMHIYIKNGFHHFKKVNISILEIGFGTGLNCLLTMLESIKLGKATTYFAIEKYPLTMEEVSQINYAKLLNSNRLDIPQFFNDIHLFNWNEDHYFSWFFHFKKIEADLKEFKSRRKFDLIYFDAFAPDVQPDLWTKEIFDKMYSFLNPKGILITYSSKGTVKQALRDAGFFIHRLNGPEGKRHILMASKEFQPGPAEITDKPKQAKRN